MKKYAISHIDLYIDAIKAGKRYEIINEEDGDFFEIVDDTGDIMGCRFKNCPHLMMHGGDDWEVVTEHPQSILTAQELTQAFTPIELADLYIDTKKALDDLLAAKALSDSVSRAMDKQGGINPS
jgi:hypothetical protein